MAARVVGPALGVVALLAGCQSAGPDDANLSADQQVAAAADRLDALAANYTDDQDRIEADEARAAADARDNAVVPGADNGA